MKFYEVVGPPYLETNAFSIGLGARLLQVSNGMNCGHDKIPDNAILCPIAFASKSLSSVEWHYSNTECKAFRIIHGQERFLHYHFMEEVCVITDHKPLMVILSKAVAMLSQQLQQLC